MLATASRWLRRHWLEALWGLFALANVAILLAVTGWETIPFHNVWVSLALLFCYRLWSPRVLVVVLGAVVAISSGAMLYVASKPSGPGFDELAEVPMMTAMFLVGVWYAWGRRRAIDDLTSAAERERDLIRDISHHLRTPITVALGHAELIRSAAEGETAEDAQIVAEELHRVSVMSDRLLLLASAQDERFLAHELVDVGALLRAVARRWTGTAPRDWRVEVRAEGTVVGDEERLGLALDCLVENAVKATSAGDTISLSSRSVVGGGVMLSVSDTGVGIEPAELDHVFDRFARGSRKGDGPAGGGAGLGLALVDAIADAHGGSAVVESVPAGGATFGLVLHGFQPAVDPELARDPDPMPLVLTTGALQEFDS